MRGLGVLGFRVSGCGGLRELEFEIQGLREGLAFSVWGLGFSEYRFLGLG